MVGGLSYPIFWGLGFWRPIWCWVWGWGFGVPFGVGVGVWCVQCWGWGFGVPYGVGVGASHLGLGFGASDQILTPDRFGYLRLE